MDNRFAAAIAAQVESAPMTHGAVPIVQGRVLLADGDGLAYYCSGNEETHPAEARGRLLDKLRSAKVACGAETVKILLTAPHSHKGYRYAIANVKPYQGHRKDGRRPKNWESLRNFMMEGGAPYDIVPTATAEADDLFAFYSQHESDVVILTQDKDMQMVPGLHMDWLSHVMFKLQAGAFNVPHNDTVYGRKWFWLQLLQGDQADNIPGLPKYEARPKVFKTIGEVTAAKFLADVSSDMGALLVCQGLYRSYYKDEWLSQMLEQGILLWMRANPDDVFDVCAPGNPFAALTDHELYPAAKAIIAARITEAITNVAQVESCGSGGSPLESADSPGEQVCSVPVAVPTTQGSPGSRPLDGADTSNPAPDVQCPAGQSREQLSPVRDHESPGFSTWGRWLLAKA